MKAPGILKTMLILFLVNYLESFTAPSLLKIYVAVPLTFIVFSALAYRSSQNINPFYALSIGLYVDLISNSLFGLNVILFCLISYVINSYSNTFKLFSYLQVCIFFGAASVFFTGLSNLFLAIENFSYIILFVSFFFNTSLCFLVALSPLNKLSIDKRLSQYD